MTTTEARAIIEEQMGLKINADNDIAWEMGRNSPGYVSYLGRNIVQFDGDFTPDQLEALACWVRAHDKEEV